MTNSQIIWQNQGNLYFLKSLRILYVTITPKKILVYALNES